MPSKTIYIGPFVHTTLTRQLDICESGAIGVNEDGKIAFIERNAASYSPSNAPEGWRDAKVVRMEGDGFFFPGFIGPLP